MKKCDRGSRQKTNVI